MQIIAGFMVLMGVAMAGIWTRDIITAEQLDITAGRLRARDPRAGTLMFPHWIGEYGTAVCLVVGAVGLLIGANWARSLAFVALGALVCTSVNSLGWALAEQARFPYAVPMTVGALGGLAAIVGLFVI
jgi:hypothetical protein